VISNAILIVLLVQTETLISSLMITRLKLPTKYMQHGASLRRQYARHLASRCSN